MQSEDYYPGQRRRQVQRQLPLGERARRAALQSGSRGEWKTWVARWALGCMRAVGTSRCMRMRGECSRTAGLHACRVGRLRGKGVFLFISILFLHPFSFSN
jgi:hypothetical protein